MRQILLISGCLLLCGGAAFGQALGTNLEFEAASVRAVQRPGPQMRGMQGGPGSPDPTRFTATYAELGNLLLMAYGLDKSDRISGPSWMFGSPLTRANQFYDVVAKVPAGATEEQFQKMLQNLLLERFQITLHFEKRDFTAYEVTVAKGGLKMKESVINPGGPSGPEPDGRPAVPGLAFKDGYPVLAPGNTPRSWGIEVNGRMLFTARQRGMDEIAARLLQSGLAIENGPGGAGVRVVDKTGLTGKYDFHFQYALPNNRGLTENLPPGADYLDSIGEPAPDVVTAAQQQLGLTLAKGKIVLDVLVIDHAEKVPTEN